MFEFNFDKATTFFNKLAKESKSKDNVSVIVGYTASYSWFVHENIEADRVRAAAGRGGKSKFLEGPARRLEDEVAKMIVTVYEKTKSMSSALTIAGLRIQRESQKEVPVLTGNLKNSAFTRKETGQPIGMFNTPEQDRENRAS